MSQASQRQAAGRSAEDAAEDDEAALVAQCRREGPPGPANSALVAAPGARGGAPGPGTMGPAGRIVAASLAESVAWLCALQALQLPLDRFHLGAGGPPGASPMGTHNLAAMARSLWPPRRWHLVVFVRRVEMVAGEITAVVMDPTGEAEATIDRHVPRAWPHAATEGSVLLLANVVAVPPLAAPPRVASRGQPRLLVMERSLGRCFAPADASPEDAARLLAEAKAQLAG